MEIERVPLSFAHHCVDVQTPVNLSAVRPDGTCLWIAGDETATVERLNVDGAGYGEHATFRLADVLTLPGGPDDEVDGKRLLVVYDSPAPRSADQLRDGARRRGQPVTSAISSSAAR